MTQKYKHMDNVIPLRARPEARYGSEATAAHLYPYVRVENGVRVYHKGRWRLATLMKAHSYEGGCQAVVMGEKERIRLGKRKDGTPILGGPVMREFNVEEVRPV